MSTLCRATLERLNVQGARPSRSLGGASRAALQAKDVFGGTPNTARETHALPVLKPMVFGFIVKPRNDLGQACQGESNRVKVNQTDLVKVLPPPGILLTIDYEQLAENAGLKF
jgi:hypothetical protein